MVAAPRHATFTFATRGGNISVDAYFSDVANALVTFDDGQGAGASSNTFWIAPVDCILVDVSVVTGLTDTARAMISRNSIPVGSIIDYTTHVSTAAYRPVLKIGFPRGSKLSIIQLA